MYSFISQQEHVISELREYSTSVPSPHYADNIALTIQYLEACNQMFERGILAHHYWKFMLEMHLKSVD